jgi:cytidylate kinase
LNKKITIAIDGFSSTGKSTLAKQLAHNLGYVYVDTGQCIAQSHYLRCKEVYRAEYFDKESLISLPTIRINSDTIELGFAEMYLNDTNVEKEIRTIEVSSFVSKVATITEVRAKLVEQGNGK